MVPVLLAIHLMIAIALVCVVLLQRSEGGGLGIGGGGGMSGLMSGRGTANLLTRATAILAAAFFASSLALAILESSQGSRHSLLDQPGGAPSSSSGTSAPATAPASGGQGNGSQGNGSQGNGSQSGSGQSSGAQNTTGQTTGGQSGSTAPAQPSAPLSQ